MSNSFFDFSNGLKEKAKNLFSQLQKTFCHNDRYVSSAALNAKLTVKYLIKEIFPVDTY